MAKITQKQTTKYFTSDGGEYDTEDDALDAQIFLDLEAKIRSGIDDPYNRKLFSFSDSLNVSGMIHRHREKLIDVLEEHGQVVGTRKLLQAQERIHNTLCSLESKNPNNPLCYNELLSVCHILGLSAQHPHAVD